MIGRIIKFYDSKSGVSRHGSTMIQLEPTDVWWISFVGGNTEWRTSWRYDDPSIYQMLLDPSMFIFAQRAILYTVTLPSSPSDIAIVYRKSWQYCLILWLDFRLNSNLLALWQFTKHTYWATNSLLLLIQLKNLAWTILADGNFMALTACLYEEKYLTCLTQG